MCHESFAAMCSSKQQHELSYIHYSTLISIIRALSFNINFLIPKFYHGVVMVVVIRGVVLGVVGEVGS